MQITSLTLNRATVSTRHSPRSLSNGLPLGAGALLFLANLVALATLGGLPLAAGAQVPVLVAPSNELIRQQERERVQRQAREAGQDVRLDAGKAEGGRDRIPDDETPCFPIRLIELDGQGPGNGGNDADHKTNRDANRDAKPVVAQFNWALAAADLPDDPATGRCLGEQGINRVITRIQNALIARGYVTTRVLAPPQDLKSGVLKLALVPGRLHDIRLTPDSSPRATLWNAIPAARGDLLNLRDIEQALEDLKRLPSVDADIQIAPADGDNAAPGDSDVLVQWRQSRPVRVSLGVDDAGSKFTGKNQGSATMFVDNGMMLNDLLYLTWNQGLGSSADDAPGNHGTHGYIAHYSLPYGYWLLGFTASATNYHQTVAGASQQYRYSGESSNRELRISRVVYRDAVRKTTLSAKGWLRSSNNFIDDTEIDVQRRRMAGWEAGVGHKEFIGSHTLDVNLAYRRGTGAFNAIPAPEENFGEGTARPSLWIADLQYSAPFKIADQSLRYTGVWRTQRNRSPLVPQDRFSIGGRYTVRGFDGENTLSAERGDLLRNDLGIALGTSGQELYLGLDHGAVAGPSSRTLVGKRLTGAAIGWRGSYRSVSADLFVGQPVNKPNGFTTSNTTSGFSLNWSL